jgi:formate hydrogenlyase transcriptional activator
MMPIMASPQHKLESINLELLIDSIPALIHTGRPDGYLDYFNKPWLEYLGVTLDEVAGWNWTAFVHPEDVEGILAKWRACLATGEIFEYETRVRSANGDYRWMFHRKVPLRDANGNIVKWYGSSVDIDERKTAEEQLRRNANELLSLAVTVTSEHHVDSVLRNIVEGLAAQPGVALARIWLLPSAALPGFCRKPSDSSDYLRLVASAGTPRNSPGEDWSFLQGQFGRVPFSVGKVGEVAANRKPILIRDVAAQSDWIVRPEWAKREGIRSFAGHPLIFRDKLLGVIGVFSRRALVEQEFSWLGLFANQAAVAIANARNAEELRTSEFYLAEGQRLAHMGSWAFDPDGFYYWSPELFRMYGLDPASKPPSVQEYLNCVHPQERESMADLIKGILVKASRFDATKRIVRPNGEVRYIRCVGAPVVENQSLKEYVGSALDVTEHELLTQELRRREAYLTEAQRLSHTGSFGWDVLSGEVYWSDETFRIFELEPKIEITTDLILQRTHPDDRQTVQQLIERASSERTEFALEHRLLTPDGSIKYLRVVGRPSQDEGRRSEFVGAVTDITDQRQAEESLRESESYLAEAQKLSHTGSWAWSPDTDVRVWSEECYRVLGFDPRDGAPRLEELIQRIHPDDQPAFRQSAERAMHNQFDEELDYRIVHPDSVVRNIHSIGHPVLSPSGDLIEYTGTVIDITERKRAEEELRASERKYRHLVDTTPAFVNTALPNGDVDFFNHGWEEYVGLPFIDMLGWRWTSAIHPEDVEAFVGKWRAALESGERFVAEARVRRADGEYRWFLQRSEPLRNEAGEIVKWYGSSIEIHERKTAEDKIREQETELRQMLDLAPQLVAVYGPNRERLYANRSVLDYLGIGHHEWQRSAGNSTHPDDLERVKACWDRALGSGSGYDVELRLRKYDGSYRWFLARYNPVRDEQGQIMRWYVAATDIEDRKQAEDRLRHENVALREEIDKASMFEEIVGSSSVLQVVLSRVSKVAPTDSTVLITGETGTGKELIARAIHRRSQRSSRAFVSVNCAAIPRDLIASELFGHEKGSFTGATQQRLGRFELANGGTIFLDEVGELPAETQIALLRVLQEHEFERVGGSRAMRADVRVVAATNRDLQAAISAGTFRSDLFYRLHVFPIELPSLRERRTDIPLLVEYFIDRYARKAGKNITTVDKKTLRLLESYPWPGNIRELQNVIERSVIVCETANFSVDESWLSQQPLEKKAGSQLYLSEKVATQEKEIIEAALRESQGRVFGPSGAAAKLGIARSTLESKIRSLKIDKNRFRTLSEI